MQKRKFSGGLGVLGLAGLLVLGLAALPAAEDPPRFTEWSACERLPDVVNDPPLSDAGAFISKDGLSLFFGSNGRSDGFGNFDIYVSKRASMDDPWGPPENLGPDINTEFNEQTPAFSVDGHRMFFASDREYAPGYFDLYVARRQDKRDPFRWGLPENLGDGVNASDWPELGPAYFEDEAAGVVLLFFSSYRSAATSYEILASTLGPDGAFGPAVPVPELNSPKNDMRPSIRHDGLEIFFDGNRTGTLGGSDLWVSTRPSTTTPWSTPENLGGLVNSTAGDVRPSISWDGTELYYHSFRDDPAGKVADLYRCTRAKITGRNK